MNNWLNYHHLYYFWTIATEESVSLAAEKLKLAQPTLSAQLRQLEDSLQTKLFVRRGRGLSLTEDGKLVFKYASNIFSLGKEMQAVLAGAAQQFDLSLKVGVTDSLPKYVIHKTLLPLYSLEQEVRVECYEGKKEHLISELASHNLDLVLTDSPFASQIAAKVFNHPIGSSKIAVFGTAKLRKTLKGELPDSLNGAPFLLPTKNTILRKAVDIWFEHNNLSPRIIAEFEDSALLKVFGGEGLGLFPMATVVQDEVEKHYKVKKIGDLKGVKEEFFAISLERKVTHPAILTIAEWARMNFRF